MVEENNPLVSINVITYNSSKFVLETLESAKAQTYQNIELIVSDDCSTDNTVEICREWIEINKDRFVRTELITVEKNTGIPANMNRAVKASRGEWIKFIAGDDIFANDSIMKLLNYAQSDNRIKFITSNIKTFRGKFSIENTSIYPTFGGMLLYTFFGKHVTALKQNKILQKTFQGCGTNVFVNKNAFCIIGGFDERFPMQEDHSFFLNITKRDYKLYWFDEPTIYHRAYSSSVSHSRNMNSYYSNNQLRLINEYRYKFIFEHMNHTWRVFLKYQLYIQTKIQKYYKQNRIMFYTFYFLDKFVNPFMYYKAYIKIDNLIHIKLIKK